MHRWFQTLSDTPTFFYISYSGEKHVACFSGLFYSSPKTLRDLMNVNLDRVNHALSNDIKLIGLWAKKFFACKPMEAFP